MSKDGLNDEKTIEYDYPSMISFVGNIMSMCFILAGFAFTGIILFIREEPITPLSQVILFILSLSMEVLLLAAFRLHFIKVEISVNSPKPIIPIYPNQWPKINMAGFLGMWGLFAAVALMFLLKNLVILFVLSVLIGGYGGIMSQRYWRSVEKKLRRKGTLK